MFVGHGVLAFAAAAAIARWKEWPRDRALAVGLLAGAFATLPDVDMVYALVGLAGTLDGVAGASAGFWDAAAVTHRSATHSLLVGGVTAGMVALWRRGGSAWPRRLAVGTGGGLVLVAALRSGPLDAAVIALFVAGAFALAHLAGRAALRPGAVLGASALGLLTHPFGDLFTGTPPALLYPLPASLLEHRLALFGDPTLDLLVPFFLELAALWLGLFALAHLRGLQLRASLRPPAGLGVGYGGAVLAVPAPTLETPSPFVFSVLATTLVALPVAIRGTRPRRWRVVTTALAAVTVAGLAYLAAYLAVG